MFFLGSLLAGVRYLMHQPHTPCHCTGFVKVVAGTADQKIENYLYKPTNSHLGNSLTKHITRDEDCKLKAAPCNMCGSSALCKTSMACCTGHFLHFWRVFHAKGITEYELWRPEMGEVGQGVLLFDTQT